MKASASESGPPPPTISSNFYLDVCYDFSSLAASAGGIAACWKTT
jgi:hypothetical protein